MRPHGLQLFSHRKRPSFIIFDTLRRYLEYKGYNVKFVQNFTDIDDKMIKRANEEGITVKELADKFINEYFVDAKGLGIKEATVHPRATENIDAIIEMIKKLEEKGFAYNVDGDVYFSARKFTEYGKLSHQSLEDLELGARIDVDERKKDPWILRCGRLKSRESLHGTARGKRKAGLAY